MSGERRTRVEISFGRRPLWSVDRALLYVDVPASLNRRLQGKCLRARQEYGLEIVGIEVLFVVLAIEGDDGEQVVVSRDVEFVVADGRECLVSETETAPVGLENEVKEIMDILSSEAKIRPRAILVSGPLGSGLDDLGNAVFDRIRSQGRDWFRAFLLDIPQLVLEAEGGHVLSSTLPIKDSERMGCSCVVIVRDLDSLQDNDRILNWLQQTVQRANEGSSVFVIGLCDDARLETLPSSITKPSSNSGFQYGIKLGIPNEKERVRIVERSLGNTVDSMRQEIAKRTAGFGRDDMIRLCQVVDSISAEGESIHCDNLLQALQVVRPTQLRDLDVKSSFLNRPKMRWQGVGGYGKIKQRLSQALEWQWDHSTALERLGVGSPTGVLLHGPSGCGKTLMANTLAKESIGCNFMSIKASDLFSKYIGESEHLIRQIFKKARAASPCILFIDEIDAIASKRSFDDGGGGGVQTRMLTTLLNEMDGVDTEKGKVVLLGATNRIDAIDEALLRPGRFDEIILVPLPETSEDRLAILQCCTRSNELLSEDVDLENLARDDRLDGLSGAQINSLVTEASLCALRMHIRRGDDLQVTAEHFEHVLKTGL